MFNLDLSMGWHNFHVHGQRWQFADETIDTRSIGPAESFVVDTIVPQVLLLPAALEPAQRFATLFADGWRCLRTDEPISCASASFPGKRVLIAEPGQEHQARPNR